VVGVLVSLAGATMDHLEMRSSREASQSRRRRPRGQQGSSCSCCPVATRGCGVAKKRPPPLARLSSFPRTAGPPSARDTLATGSQGYLVAVVGVMMVAAAAARAAKVFLLRLPFGRPCFRDAGGAISGALVFFPVPSPLVAEPLEEDMAGQSLEERRRKEGKCSLNHKRSQHLKRSGEGDGARRFGNHSRIVCTREGKPLWSPQRIMGGNNGMCR
jgi:hypothetical protein